MRMPDRDNTIERIHEAIDMGVCVDLFMDVLELLKEQEQREKRIFKGVCDLWEEITKAFNKHSKMIVELAARTLSVNDYKEFVDEFSKKADNKDDLIEDLMQKGW